MIESTSRFLASTLVVQHNAVKSILFRLAELLLGYAVYKYFSFIAAKCDAFTAYLLFREDVIQRGLYVFSSKFSRAGILVLIFGTVILVADLYGVLLWSLDAPGFDIQKYNTSAKAIAGNLLTDAGYVVQIRAQPGIVDGLEEKIPELVGANLAKPGVNFTLLGVNQRNTPKIGKPTRPFKDTFARIWLDDDGWSVSPDQYFTLVPSGDDGIAAPLNCPWKELNPGLDAFWNCTFDNTYAISLARDKTIGVPEIHWDDKSDTAFDTRYIQPGRSDNPWASLGTGGTTASIMQMFTVSKGQTRHTFLQSAFKATMLSTDAYKTLSRSAVTDLVKRTYSQDPAEQNDPIVEMVVSSIMSAQSKNMSFSAGVSATGRDGYSVGQVAWELLTPSVGGVTMYSMLRASIVNITLWRTDELPEPVKPFRPQEKCAGAFMNLATGGQVYDTDCYASMGAKDPRFYGQVDNSAVMIVSGLMGFGRSNDSSEALNQKGYEWLLKNEGWLANLILSRGMIVGSDPDLVTIELSKIKPAVSYLQLMLVFLSAILAGLGWLVMFRYEYYTSSLLAILLTTADVDHKRKKPGYLSHIPDIHLGEKGSKTMMAVPQGAFVVDSSHQLQPSRSGRRGYQAAPGQDEEIRWSTAKIPDSQATTPGVFTPQPQFPQSTEYQGAAQQWQRAPSPVSPVQQPVAQYPSQPPQYLQPQWQPPPPV